MKLPRRTFLHLAAGAAALPAVSRTARALTYPTRPVRIVVGYTAGGLTDFLARLMSQWLSERLSQQFIVENRPGAGTNIATESVVRAPADGYSLLTATAANAINATLYDKLNFNFIRDTAPIASIARLSFVLTVIPSFPAKTLPAYTSKISVQTTSPPVQRPLRSPTERQRIKSTKRSGEFLLREVCALVPARAANGPPCEASGCMPEPR